MTENGEHPSALIERGEWKLTPLVAAYAMARFAIPLAAPALVVSDVIAPNVFSTTLAVFGFAVIVWDAVYATVRHVAVIYGVGDFKPVIRSALTSEEWSFKVNFVVTFDLVKAYAYLTYAYVLTYTFLSSRLPDSFNVPLGLGDAVYFSVATIATVGYGDITAKSGLARALVVGEIFTGLLYAVFIFSLIATRLKRSHGESGQKPAA